MGMGMGMGIGMGIGMGRAFSRPHGGHKLAGSCTERFTHESPFPLPILWLGSLRLARVHHEEKKTARDATGRGIVGYCARSVVAGSGTEAKKTASMARGSGSDSRAEWDLHPRAKRGEIASLVWMRTAGFPKSSRDVSDRRRRTCSGRALEAIHTQGHPLAALAVR